MAAQLAVSSSQPIIEAARVADCALAEFDKRFHYHNIHGWRERTDK
jgi:hypothetical protein